MKLPPLPPDPVGKEWTDEEAKIIQAYGELCIRTVQCRNLPKSKPMFNKTQLAAIRKMIEAGEPWKIVNKLFPMSEATYQNIKWKRRAYK